MECSTAVLFLLRIVWERRGIVSIREYKVLNSILYSELKRRPRTYMVGAGVVLSLRSWVGSAATLRVMCSLSDLIKVCVHKQICCVIACNTQNRIAYARDD